MALSFLKALNPTSKESGIYYQNNSITVELIDSTLSKNICTVFSKKLNFFSSFNETFNLLVGDHYSYQSKDERDPVSNFKTAIDFFTSHLLTPKVVDEDKIKPATGSKGALDFLIFPLIARKLANDYKNNPEVLSKVLSSVIILSLELVRFTAAIALTLLLAPVVALISLVRNNYSPAINEKNPDIQNGYYV